MSCSNSFFLHQTTPSGPVRICSDRLKFLTIFVKKLFGSNFGSPLFSASPYPNKVKISCPAMEALQKELSNEMQFDPN